jgi:hypothetical protein
MIPCPSDAELMEYWRSPSTAGPIGRHVEQCPTCQREIAAFQRAGNLVAGVELEPVESATSCLDDLAVAALVENRLDATERQVAVGHLSRCSECRRRVGAVSRAVEDDAIAREIRAVESIPVGSARRWLRAAGGLAAAAVALFVIRTVDHSRRRDVQREEPVTLISAPRPVQPTGIVDHVESLSWRSVPRAYQYRVTLFSEDGTTVWETGTGDTVVTIPATVHLNVEAPYYWKVEARSDWDRWAASELVEIRIRRQR